MTHRVALAIALLLAIAGCQPSAAPTPTSGILAVPGRESANPSLAAHGSTVMVSWTAADPAGPADAFVATSTDGGQAFGPPVRVNDLAGTVRTQGEQAPRLAIGRQVAAVVWTAREQDRPAIRLAISRDRGRTFGRPIRVHTEGLTGARGWPSVAIDGDDKVHVLWLDGRNAGAKPAPHAGHSAAGMTGMDHGSAPRQDLLRAVVTPDGSVTEFPVAASVCFCCRTAVGLAGDGSGLAAWRHVFPGSIRDIGVARFAASDVAAPPMHRVSEDGWELQGCPEDGPALAIDSTEVAHVVWPTLVPGSTKGVFHAASRGNAFSARERLDMTPGIGAAHPQVAVTTAGTIGVVWEELGGAGHRIVLRRKLVGAAGWSEPQVLNGPHAGAYPAITSAGDRLIVAWTSRTAPLSTIAVAEVR